MQLGAISGPAGWAVRRSSSDMKGLGATPWDIHGRLVPGLGLHVELEDED